jgi:hypothetical protein
MECQQPDGIEKRKKVTLTPEEREILKFLFFKALFPVISIIVVSSVILFLGFQFLMKKTSFTNYGINPVGVLHNVSQFISTYTVIALANLLLMIALSVIVLYLALYNTVLPLLRITRGLKKHIECRAKSKIYCRHSDKLFVPLVELINKLLSENSGQDHKQT